MHVPRQVTCSRKNVLTHYEPTVSYFTDSLRYKLYLFVKSLLHFL